MKITQLPGGFTAANHKPNSPQGKENPIGDVIDKLTLSPMQIGLDLLDGTMGLAYSTRSFPEAFQTAGYVVGAAHGALAVGYLFGCIDQADEVQHQRVGLAVGNALCAAGHIAGAAGAGVWSLAPLVGGMIACTLQDYRIRNQ